MILRGPSRKTLGEFPPADVAVYDYLGKQAERIVLNDNLTMGELCKPWKAFKHPTYGNIEITL